MVTKKWHLGRQFYLASENGVQASGSGRLYPGMEVMDLKFVFSYCCVCGFETLNLFVIVSRMLE